MSAVDYSRYQTLDITRRGPTVDGVPSVLDIRMKADGPGGNGKLPTAGHEGHWELSEIWRDVGRDDSVRCAVLRGSGMGFSGGGDLALVQDMATDFEVRTRVWKEARDLVYNVINCRQAGGQRHARGPAVGAGLVCRAAGRYLHRHARKAPRSSTATRGWAWRPGDHAAIVWPLLCGMAKAKYYLLTVRPAQRRRGRADRPCVAVPCDEDALLDAKALAVVD